MADYTETQIQRTKYITNGVSGLRNLGNSCYMNSILQCLSHIDPFRTWLIGGHYKQRLDSNLPKLKHDLITPKLAELFKTLWENYAEVSPQSIKSAIGKKCDTFDNKDQQDSHEFLNVLLDTIHDEVSGKVIMEFNNVPDEVNKFMKFMEFYNRKEHTQEEKQYLTNNLTEYKKYNPNVVTIYNAYEYWRNFVVRSHSMITNLFTGLYYSSIECDECHNIVDTFDPFINIALPINERGTMTLEEALKEFTKEEILTGDNKFYCSKCSHEVNAHKKTYIWEPPRILVIQLKRFKNTNRNYNNFNVNSTRKITTKVVFPFEGLDLAPQLSELHKVPCTKYDLYATSNHNSKICNMGHYVAYCKKSINNSWYKFDDDDVYYIPPESIKDKVITEDAYILFYVRQ